MKILVDKLPDGCGACLFFHGAMCPLLNKVSYGTGSRLKGCPLIPIIPDKPQFFSEEWECETSTRRNTNEPISTCSDLPKL